MSKIIEIDGKKYEVDVGQAIAQGLIEEIKVAVGQRFRNKSTGYKYILAAPAGNSAVLINLKVGCRYDDAVTVSNLLSITQKEWNKITAGDSQNFEEIS